MNPAQRTLSYWLLTALVERGCDSAAALPGHHWQPARSIRALTAAELRQLGVPLLRLRFLPTAESRRKRAS